MEKDVKIYTFTDYRAFVRYAVEKPQKAKAALTYGALAKAARIEKTYLSHVLNGRGELNADQLFLIGEFLGLDDEALEYLLLLLEIDRCQVPKRKVSLVAKRNRVREEKLKSESFLGRDSASCLTAETSEYYSSPIYQLVHMCMTIPEFLKNPALIAKELHLSQDHLNEALGVLMKCGLLSRDERGYRLSGAKPYINEKSPVFRTYQTGFRLKAIEKLQAPVHSADQFFSLTFSGDDAAQAEIKKKFLAFLKWLSPVIDSAPSTGVFHINFDLFKVTR